MSSFTLDDSTAEFVAGLLEGTGVVEDSYPDLNGGNICQISSTVNCAALSQYRNGASLTIDLSNRDASTTATFLPEGFEPQFIPDDTLYVTGIDIHDPSAIIKDNIINLLNYSLVYMDTLHINSRNVGGTLPTCTQTKCWSSKLTSLKIRGSIRGDITSDHDLGKATTIDLSNNQLTSFSATVPLATKIILSNNRLTAFSVSTIGMETLSLNSNRLTTFSMDSYRNVTSLDVSDNLLTQLDASDKRTLDTLNASHNKIRALPTNLTTATRFDMSSNALSGTLNLPSTGGGAAVVDDTELQVFNVSQNPDLRGTVTLAADSFPEVQAFDVSGTGLDLEIDPGWIESSSTLEVLVAANTTVKFSGNKFPTKFPTSLRVLDLSNAGLTVSLPESLASQDLSHVEVINLEGNQLSGCIPWSWYEKKELRLLVYAPLFAVGDPVATCLNVSSDSSGSGIDSGSGGGGGKTSGLSKGAIAGIAVGSAVGALVIAAIILLICWRRGVCCFGRANRRRSNGEPADVEALSATETSNPLQEGVDRNGSTRVKGKGDSDEARNGTNGPVIYDYSVNEDVTKEARQISENDKKRQRKESITPDVFEICANGECPEDAESIKSFSSTERDKDTPSEGESAKNDSTSVLEDENKFSEELHVNAEHASGKSKKMSENAANDDKTKLSSGALRRDHKNVANMRDVAQPTVYGDSAEMKEGSKNSFSNPEQDMGPFREHENKLLENNEERNKSKQRAPEDTSALLAELLSKPKLPNGDEKKGNQTTGKGPKMEYTYNLKILIEDI